MSSMSLMSVIASAAGGGGGGGGISFTSGAVSSDAVSVTPAWPAGVANDDPVFLHVETHAQNTDEIAAPTGWTKVGQVQSQVGGSGWYPKTAVFWKRYATAETAPTIAVTDTGISNHVAACITKVDGLAATGTPIRSSRKWVERATGTSFIAYNAPAKASDAIATFFGSGDDDAVSGLACADMTLTTQYSTTHLEGNDGLIGMVWGEPGSAGEVAEITGTKGSGEHFVGISVALIPFGESTTRTSYRHFRVAGAWTGTPHSYQYMRELEARETVGGADVLAGGTWTASSEYNATYAASKAEVGVSGYWSTTNGGGSGSWIEVDMLADKDILEAVVTPESSAAMPSIYKFWAGATAGDEELLWIEGPGIVTAGVANTFRRITE